MHWRKFALIHVFLLILFFSFFHLIFCWLFLHMQISLTRLFFINSSLPILIVFFCFLFYYPFLISLLIFQHSISNITLFHLSQTPIYYSLHCLIPFLFCLFSFLLYFYTENSLLPFHIILLYVLSVFPVSGNHRGI